VRQIPHCYVKLLSTTAQYNHPKVKTQVSNKIGKVYFLGYTEVPKVFFTPQTA
jgi:hypothetical protein